MNEGERENVLAKQLGCYELRGTYYNPYCAGCGYGIIANLVNRVLLKRENRLSYPLITGVGCSLQMPYVLVGKCFYCLHGRTMPFVTGLKLSNPELKPIVFSGDGDSLAIGLGHFMHAARRNLDVVVLLLNNEIYGMTGGQAAPTTARGANTTTSPFGMKERAFDGVKVAMTAGATYVARWTVAQPFQLMRSIEKALDHKGFSLIEIISICPTYRGRFNNLGTPAEMLRQIRRDTINIKEAETRQPAELEGKHVVGEFIQREDIPELSQVYHELILEARGG
jgi:2-oxoglutarate ferredoxin oxidoreductase subunit beta